MAWQGMGGRRIWIFFKYMHMYVYARCNGGMIHTYVLLYARCEWRFLTPFLDGFPAPSVMQKR